MSNTTERRITIFTEEDAISVLQAMPKHMQTVLSPLPTPAAVTKAVNQAFLASLLTDEGRAVRFALVLMAEHGAATSSGVAGIAPRPHLQAQDLRKLAPATDPWSVYILADPTKSTEEVWGLLPLPSKRTMGVRMMPLGLVIRVLGPGTVRVGFGTDIAWSIDRGELVGSGGSLPSFLMLLGSALGADLRDARAYGLLRVVRQIERLGHGGTLAVCERSCDGSVEGTKRTVFGGPVLTVPIQEATGRSGVSFCAEQSFAFGPGCATAKDIELKEAIDTPAQFLARLANVDGAVLLDRSDLSLIAFGATLTASAAPKEVFMITAGDPNPSRSPSPFSMIRGTRHQSAIRWVFDDPRRLAIVISSDGTVSLVHRVGSGELVVVRGLTPGEDDDIA
jgi:hypothetical protein